MNLATITKTVAELAPEAKDIRARDLGGAVYVLLAEVEGRMRAVQFARFGLYGDPVLALGLVWNKSDLQIAAEIAKELRK